MGNDVYRPNRNTIEQVKDMLYALNPDIVITDDTYVNNTIPLNCKCLSRNHVFKKRWDNLQTFPYCAECRDMEKFEIIKNNHIEFIKNISPTIQINDIFKEGEHLKANCTCLICRNIWNPHIANLRKGKGCPVCYIKNKNSGENHYKYNPNLTTEEREKGRLTIGGDKLHQWRNDVYTRDDYTCVKCNERGGKLNAHHLNGWHWDKENRFNVDNGATLCADCHDDFHYIYGRRDNTKEQFEEFTMTDIA